MKKIKINYMGKPLKEIYPHATWYQVLWYKFMIWVRRVTIAGVSVGLLTAAFQLGAYMNPITVFADREIEINILPQKIDGLKDEVIAQLERCESAGHKPTDGIIILDSNNKMSIGQLMFQKTTVIYYSKLLYGKIITGQEAVAIANDEIQARQLAKDVIFKTENGVAKDWVNCSKKYGLQAKVDIIKQLEK